MKILLMMFPVILHLIGCAAVTSAPETMGPDFGRAVEKAFAAQVLHRQCPAADAYADALPGELANQIYTKRYIKMVTEEKKEKETAASQLKGVQ